nr:thioredoxin [bacterium]
MPITITKDNFQQEVMQSQLPVLIDFWAPWCGPCRMAGPIVDAVEQQTAGRAKVGKINVDEQPELAQAFQVVSIPMMVVIKGGQVAAQSVGVRPKEALIDMLGL